jgi:hypothetical protein
LGETIYFLHHMPLGSAVKLLSVSIIIIIIIIIIDLQSKHNIYFFILNSYKFRFEQFNIGPIQDLLTGKMQVHAEQIAYHSVYFGVSHNLSMIIIKL